MWVPLRPTRNSNTPNYIQDNIWKIDIQDNIWEIDIQDNVWKMHIQDNIWEMVVEGLHCVASVWFRF